MQGRIKVVVDDCNSAYQYGDYGDIPASISGTRITGYLFSPGGCEQPDASHILTIAPVRLVRNQRSYLLREPFVIDLRAVAPDQYQVHLVQDFWTDDDDPDLTACLASIFLGRRRATGEWEMPECWPIECRSLIVLGTVDTRQGRCVFSARKCDELGLG